ncbi:MAG: hypothetical protein ACLGG0_05955 [Bacteriovoracia bacterium]
MKILKQNQKGQALMEYVIVSGLVGIMCLIAVKQFGEAINTRIKNMKSQITENIQIDKN